MSKNNRLGRGLEALLGGNVEGIIDEIEKNYDSEEIIQLSLNEISPNPYQPRSVFDETKIKELAQSIKEHGMFTPIIVKKTSSGYTIIAGERRYRANKLLNNETISALVVDFDEKLMMEIALLENIQRENLNPIEEARSLKMIMEKNNYTQDDVAKKMGKSRSHIANILRLLTLNSKIQDLILNDRISMGHAKVLIGLEDDQLDYVIDEILDKKLSVRDSEKLVQELKKKEVKPEKKVKVKTLEIQTIENYLTEQFSSKVEVTNNKLIINFENEDDLNRILDIMKINID